jgi:transposase
MRPLFARELRAAHSDQPLEWWFQDEARIGQQGTLTNVWSETGSRPQRVRQTEYDWVYVYAAVNAETGASSAMLAPDVNTDYMNAHLQFISAQVTKGSHGILVLDQAGWHVAKRLKVPQNLTLLHLPAYSPELNPVERVWAYPRSHYMSNRLFKDYEQLFNLTAAAWNRLDRERLKSICHTAWIERAA